MSDAALSQPAPAMRSIAGRDIGLKRRYAAERRFRFFGLTAVVLSAGFLLFLLVTMATAGLSGFSQTRVALPIDFRGSGLSIDLDSMTEEEAQEKRAEARRTHGKH